MDGTVRILGVDDSITIRKALEIILQPAGYDLQLATNGAETIDRAKALKPSLILLDFILPDMRGTDVCRQLAADPDTADIPVVLISAKGAEIRQAYRDIRNVVSYITKPFKPQAVTSTVAEVLERAAAGTLAKLSVRDDDVPIQFVASEMLPADTEIEETPAVFASNPQSVRLDNRYVAAGNNGADELSDDEDPATIESVPRPASLNHLENEAARRDVLNGVFETLRSSLEGVYVEEIDTPAGATADRAKTYTDLIDELTRQLEEGLQHARSGTRHRLYGDGSIRSFDETLLDIFRRSCRLLFRAAVSGAVGGDIASNGRRILFACHRDSPLYASLKTVTSAHPDWPVFLVAENFRQLPMITRLYGPTHLVVEITWAGALWDQLRLLQRLPEAQNLSIIGITDPGRFAATASVDSDARRASLAERGVARVVDSASEVERALEITPTHHRPFGDPPAADSAVGLGA